ncbi:MAG TPA: hypothetical protein VMU75_05220 [Acidimicrobiales bacterium]|nr:hypothetical protein [Acidimicrobiales bacterium]
MDAALVLGAGAGLGDRPAASSLVVAGVPLLGAGLARVLLEAVTSWVVAGAASFVSALGSVLQATTQPDLGTGFQHELTVMAEIGALLALPFLVLAAVHALVRQDVGLLLRAALVRLPLAVLLGAGAAQLVELALAATDELSSSLAGANGAPARTLVAHLVTVLAGSGPGAAPLAGFAGLLIAGSAAVVALVLWLELVVRSAAVAVATLFLPIALAGIVWPASAHWARRLGETIAALVLSKLVVVGVLTLAASTLVDRGGVSGMVEGVALLLLATLSPFALLRLIPMVEAGAVGQLEGAARLGGRAARSAASNAAGLALGFATGGDTAAGAGAPTVVDDVGQATGVARDSPDVLADAGRITADLEASDAARRGDAPADGTGDDRG